MVSAIAFTVYNMQSLWKIPHYVKNRNFVLFWGGGRGSLRTNRMSQGPHICSDNAVGIPLKKVTPYFLSIIKDARGFPVTG